MVNNSKYQIVIRDPAEKRSAIILSGRTNFASLAFSNDGRHFAAGEAGDRSAVLVWDLDDTRLQPRVLEGQSGTVWSVAFSPDGRLIAACSAHEPGIRLWEFNRGQLLRTIAGHAFGTTAVAFSPDGSTLATVGGDGHARLWSSPIRASR